MTDGEYTDCTDEEFEPDEADAVTAPESAEAAEAPESGGERAMSAEDYIAEIRLLQEKLDYAIAERERRERELECISQLRCAGLPEGLSEFVMKAGDDAAEVVRTIGTIIDDAVERRLRDRCRTDPPKDGAHSAITREEFLRMPVSEIQRLRNMGIKLG